MNLASLSGPRIHRCCDLWCRPAATAPIHLLAWELPYAAGVVLKDKKKKMIFGYIGLQKVFIKFLKYFSMWLIEKLQLYIWVTLCKYYTELGHMIQISNAYNLLLKSDNHLLFLMLFSVLNSQKYLGTILYLFCT